MEIILNNSETHCIHCNADVTILHLKIVGLGFHAVHICKQCAEEVVRKLQEKIGEM